MTQFTVRLSKPDKNNPYYNTRSAGGYSKACLGSPIVSGLNVMRNCVGYAYGRFHEIANRPEMDFFDPVNAENIFANAVAHGLKTGKEPRPGALIVWQKGKTLASSDGAGHVAFVERVKDDGTIITTESGWNAASDFWTGVYNPPYRYKDGYTFLGFVYQPGDGGFTDHTIRKGDKGADVELMQSRLAAKGYLRKSEIDGDFGKITLGALLAFQFEHGLKVDGVCGAKTKAELTK